MVTKKTPLVVMLALITSCGSAGDFDTPSNGHQFVSGMYFESFQGESLCTYRFHMNVRSRGDIYREIDEVLPKIDIHSEYFVTGLSYGSNAWVEISSIEFCDRGYTGEGPLAQLSHSFEKSQDFVILTSDEFSDRIGSSVLDLKSPAFSNNNCVVQVSENLDLSFAEIYDLRYRYAIPIVYHQQTADGSLLLFENNCSSAEQFISDIQLLK